MISGLSQEKLLHVNKKGTDLPAHLQILISTFVILNNSLSGKYNTLNLYSFIAPFDAFEISCI